VEICRNNPSKAIGLLQPAAPYELGIPLASQTGVLYRVYVRGEAYLRARQGSQAAAEFQKIIDNTGIVGNFPLDVLARLGLGRAYALQASVGAGVAPAQTGRPQGAPLQQDAPARGRTAYQDFFALWKDADPDISILKKAKAVYARLK